MVSLIMAVKDNLEFTEKAYSSIKRGTACDYEFIIIDNASTQETVDFLKTTDIRVIRNSENLGCAKAWNQGIMAAKGRYVCILNNDIEVPVGWLERLKQFYETHNFAWVSPMMKEGSLNYSLEEYNTEYNTRLNGDYFPDEYNAVALFSEKTLYDQVGYFDENYYLGKCEDEDMYWRLRDANLTTAITSDVLIHHYGSQTINRIKRETPGFEQKNRAYFLKKWRRVYLKRKVRKTKLKIRHTWLNRKYNFNTDKHFTPRWT